MLSLRQATASDSDSIWDIFHAVVVPGDTYAFDPNISREEALAYWLDSSARCYVAERDGVIVGTYWNSPGSPDTSMMRNWQLEVFDGNQGKTEVHAGVQA